MFQSMSTLIIVWVTKIYLSFLLVPKSDIIKKGTYTESTAFSPFSPFPPCIYSFNTYINIINVQTFLDLIYMRAVPCVVGVVLFLGLLLETVFRTIDTYKLIRLQLLVVLFSITFLSFVNSTVFWSLIRVSLWPYTNGQRLLNRYYRY